MSWANEWDIEEMCTLAARSGDPVLIKYGIVLAGWVDNVNRHSDGWAYWKAGAGAASQLTDLLARAVGHYHAGRDAHRDWLNGKRDIPSEAEFEKALRPMKALATKHANKGPINGSLAGPLAPLERIAAREAAQREAARIAALNEATIDLAYGGVAAPLKQGQLALL